MVFIWTDERKVGLNVNDNNYCVYFWLCLWRGLGKYVTSGLGCIFHLCAFPITQFVLLLHIITSLLIRILAQWGLPSEQRFSVGGWSPKTLVWQGKAHQQAINQTEPFKRWTRKKKHVLFLFCSGLLFCVFPSVRRGEHENWCSLNLLLLSWSASLARAPQRQINKGTLSTWLNGEVSGVQLFFGRGEGFTDVNIL